MQQHGLGLLPTKGINERKQHGNQSCSNKVQKQVSKGCVPRRAALRREAGLKYASHPQTERPTSPRPSHSPVSGPNP